MPDDVQRQRTSHCRKQRRTDVCSEVHLDQKATASMESTRIRKMKVNGIYETRRGVYWPSSVADRWTWRRPTLVGSPKVEKRIKNNLQLFAMQCFPPSGGIPWVWSANDWTINVSWSELIVVKAWNSEVSSKSDGSQRFRYLLKIGVNKILFPAKHGITGKWRWK